MAVAEHSDNIELQEVDNIIYESIETMTAIQERDLQKILQADRRRYKRGGVGVGFLCAVLVLLNVAIPLYLYQTNMEEREQLVNSYNQLLDRTNNLTGERDNLNKWLCDQPDDMKKRLCKSNGVPFGDVLCFYISNETKTWNKSRQWCKDKQSDLIVINSTEKQDFVERLNQRVWLGLTDSEVEGSFKWVDGTALTTPTYWNPGQPNNLARHPEQDCVEFYVNGSAPRGWNDAPCNFYKHCICERALC